MTSIKAKILRPFLLLTVLMPLVLMVAISSSLTFFVNEWAKKDLMHAANSISTSIRNEGNDPNKILPLIKATRGSSTVEVIFYTQRKRKPRLAYDVASFVNDEIRTRVYDESQKLVPGTVASFSIGREKYYIIEIEGGNNAEFEKAVYISKGLPLDQLLVNVNLVLLTGTVITIIAAVFITSRVAKSIAKPIEHVTYCIENMKSDDVLAIDEKSDSIELRKLISGFNAMSRRIYQFHQSQAMFLNRASHELRTPLMSIQGYADGIEMGVFPDYKNTAHLISEQSKRLTHLLESLLTLARAENFKQNMSLERLNLSDSISEILTGYKGYALKRNVDIQVQIENDIFANAQDELLSGAVGNIISNAIRYARSAVQISLREEDQKAIITISDDGSGISDIEHMFQRFAKGEGGNFGLGLSIAKTSVEAMNGEIRVYNRNGAVFEILLNQN